MPKKPFTKQEIETIIKLREAGVEIPAIAHKLGRTQDSVRGKISRLRYAGKIIELPTSPFPVYDKPLSMNGNALILPDVEAPFQNTEFIRRCVTLAREWSVDNLILAGDLLHMANLSAWGANWLPNEDEDKREAILDYIKTLKSQKERDAGIEMLERLGAIGGIEPDVSRELQEARKFVHAMSAPFKRVHYIIGNHEDRYIRKLGIAMRATDLLDLLQTGDKWRIAPYYYGYLTSAGETYRIEHPKPAGMNAARVIASKHLCNIIMGHSHRLSVEFDRSGRYWAIQAGMCVDERRLPYASTRSTGAPMHKLGAVIVYEGFPYVLSAATQWQRMARLVD